MKTFAQMEGATAMLTQTLYNIRPFHDEKESKIKLIEREVSLLKQLKALRDAAWRAERIAKTKL